MQKRVPGGHPDSFWNVNTLTMNVEWDAEGETSGQINEVVTGDINQDTVVDVYADRIVFEQYDFGPVAKGGARDIKELLDTLVIPNPLYDPANPPAAATMTATPAPTTTSAAATSSVKATTSIPATSSSLPMPSSSTSATPAPSSTERPANSSESPTSSQAPQPNDKNGSDHGSSLAGINGIPAALLGILAAALAALTNSGFMPKELTKLMAKFM